MQQRVARGLECPQKLMRREWTIGESVHLNTQSCMGVAQWGWGAASNTVEVALRLAWSKLVQLNQQNSPLVCVKDPHPMQPCTL